MPSSAVRSFTDPDAYAAAIRQAAVQPTVTGRGHFAAQVVRIDLHRLWMQRLSDNLPRIMHADILGGRVVIAFLTRPGPSMSWSGFEIRPADIIRLPENWSSYQHSSAGVDFGAMSLSLEDMASAGAMIAGCDLTAARDPLLVTPPAAAMAKLQRLHGEAGHLAETAPEIVAHPEAARGLEQALIGSMINCLITTAPADDVSARRRHERIMRRFHTLVEEHLDQPLYVPEICGALRVSLGTLRTCCHEHLGRSPKQYLLARRMHLARRDLGQALPGTATVTEVASRYGFWQFGRFAGAYRALFGETPSATLARLSE